MWYCGISALRDIHPFIVRDTALPSTVPILLALLSGLT